MKKILQGVIKYRQTVREDLVKQFEAIRDNPNPIAVMFTCMDSRMLPTRFTQSRVGDMFVVRNAGNLIPDAPNYGYSAEVSVTTEPAALELAVKRGGIKHVIVCGHADCKAMVTLHGLHQCQSTFDPNSPMDHWVRKNGYASMQRLYERLHIGARAEMKFGEDEFGFNAFIDPLEKLNQHDKLSQINVLQQIVNITTHDFLKGPLREGQLFLHAMWFDVYKGDVYLFSKDKKRFIAVQDLLEELNRRCGVALEVPESDNEPTKAVGLF